MNLLLHAITTESDRVDSVHGLRGERLVRLEVAGLTGWATDLTNVRTAFTREDLVENHRIVVALCERVEGCLPARFPTVLDGGEALSAKRDELRAQLDRVRGACEVAVTARWNEPLKAAESAPRTGRDYLLRRQAELAEAERRTQRATALAEALEGTARDTTRDVNRRVCPSEMIALSLALLVDRAAAEHLLEQLRRHTQPDVRILVNGPWPPYTFATGGSITK